MVNKELIDLCRLVVAAIHDTDSFSSQQLKKLLLHIVPQLLAEIDILAAVAESLSLDREEEAQVVEGACEAPPAPAVEAPRPAKKPVAKARRKKEKKRVR